jgi:hypothetical protein
MITPKIFLNKNGQPDGFLLILLKEIGEREKLEI